MWTLDHTAELIRRHEGCRLDVYKDSRGVLTVGYGHALHEGSMISFVAANKIFSDDFRQAWKQFDALDLPEMSGIRSAVCISMIFNLGVRGFLGFKKMIAAMRAGDWDAAAKEMLDSKWANQVGYRAHELSKMMRTDNPP